MFYHNNNLFSKISWRNQRNNKWTFYSTRLKFHCYSFQDGNLDTTTALIYDAVHLFAVALHELSQFQDIQIKPLDCTGETSWPHGSSLINYMKLAEFNGLSGRIKFDTQGLRTVFDIDVLELQQTGLEPIGMNSN